MILKKLLLSSWRGSAEVGRYRTRTKPHSDALGVLGG